MEDGIESCAWCEEVAVAEALREASEADRDRLVERWRHIIAQVLRLTEDGVISGGRAAEVLGVDLVTWRALANAVEGEDPAELLAAAELRPESLESKLAALCRERGAERDRLAGELAAAREREGRNPARVWQGTGRVVISRVATDGAPNACSMIYGALCRAAKALGYREVWTYTLPHELGTSLRASGFEDQGLTRGGEHDRPSRSRAPAEQPGPKRRWRRTL
jgi:hypothetical protein